jgi:hypothetical protein
LEATVKVMAELPEPGAASEVGFNITVTPEGWPDAESATAPLNPPETVEVAVEDPRPPWTTEIEAGEVASTKFGAEAVPASAARSPAPFMLPQPVARSYPAIAE